MKKIYSLLFTLLPFHALYAQCPIINGAFVNSCGTEGVNEFIVFNTTTQAPVSDYVFYYGSVTPPAANPVAILSGATARTKNGTGSIINGLCNLIFVTSGSDIIPAASTVVFLPSNFTSTYNISPFCTGGKIYVVLIDITISPNLWNVNGSLLNEPVTPVYVQVKNSTNDCLLFTRQYTNAWSISADGNLVSWDQVSGTPSYYNVGCDLITLPVKLVSFTAVTAGKNANITWQSASQINTKLFDLQRSVDGSKFSSIYNTSAAGNSNTGIKYSFIDRDIPSGSIFYRLKIIDNDGTTSYSKVVKVFSTINDLFITNIYPNPATSQVSISWNARSAGNTIAKVFDISGKKMISQKLVTFPGMNLHQLQVSSLSKGTYLLKLEKDGVTIVSEITKQ